MTIEALTQETPAARSSRVNPKVVEKLVVAIPGVLFLLFWEFASGRLIRESYVSKPTAIVARLFEIFATGEIWPNLAVTAEELVLSYVIGVASGVVKPAFGAFTHSIGERSGSRPRPLPGSFFSAGSRTWSGAIDTSSMPSSSP